MKIDLDIDSSRKLIEKAFLVCFVSVLVFPLLIFSYFKVGEKTFVENKQYYKLVSTKGHERLGRLVTIKKPLVNINGVKKWLRVSLTDLYITDLNTYSTEERWNKVQEYFTPNAASLFWEEDMKRQIGLLSNSYIVTKAVFKNDPVLLGEMKNSKGERYWKFYLEISTQNKSDLRSGFLQQEMDIIAVVKEMDPKIKKSGIGIVSIQIK